MHDETVGERVARLRERIRMPGTGKAMTQEQLSAATEGTVSEAWIAALEKGRLKMPPNLEKLSALATPLRVSYAYLLEPLRLAPLGDPLSSADAAGEAVRAILSSDLSEERKAAAMTVIRDLFAASEKTG